MRHTAAPPPPAQLCSKHLKTSQWLAACFTKECLETCLRAHSGIAEGPAVPQCKSPPHIGSSFVVISSDTVRQVHLEISEKPGQKAFTFQDPENAILAPTAHSQALPLSISL